MPDKLEDMLGTATTDEESEEQQPAKNPLEATPSGEGEEQNPLEKMDQISKAKPDKKGKGSKELDEDTIANMLMTGENTEGMFAPDVDEDKPDNSGQKLHEDVDDESKIKVGKKAEPQKKYKNMFKSDIMKHPTEYKITTPKGEMTVSEAIQQGYNPLTKQFEKEHSIKDIKEKHLSRLNDDDRAAVERLMSPSNAQVAPADADKYGISSKSPLIRQEEGPMQPSAQMPQANPMAAAPEQVGAMPSQGQIPQGMMPQAGAAPGEAMPGEEQQAGGQDLASLLGGGM